MTKSVSTTSTAGISLPSPVISSQPNGMQVEPAGNPRDIDTHGPRAASVPLLGRATPANDVDSALAPLSIKAEYSLPKSAVTVKRSETGAITVVDYDWNWERGEYTTTYVVEPRHVAALARKLGCSISDVPARLAGLTSNTAYSYIEDSGIHHEKSKSFF